MKYFFVILTILAVMLTACGQAAEQASFNFKVEYDVQGYPTGLAPSSVEASVEASVEVSGDCAAGTMLGGEIYISSKTPTITCAVVLVPMDQLNTAWGGNLSKEVPVLGIKDFLPGTGTFIFVHGGLSSFMQQLVLDELMLSGFYSSLSMRIEKKADEAFNEGRYWEHSAFKKGESEYRNLTARGNCSLSPLQLVELGSTAGAFLGGHIKTEADAYQRGRILMIYYGGEVYPGICEPQMSWWQQ